MRWHLPTFAVAAFAFVTVAAYLVAADPAAPAASPATDGVGTTLVGRRVKVYPRGAEAAWPSTSGSAAQGQPSLVDATSAFATALQPTRVGKVRAVSDGWLVLDSPERPGEPAWWVPTGSIGYVVADDE